MKQLFLIIAMTIGLSVGIAAQEASWIIHKDQVRSFLDRQDNLFEAYSVALGDAYYDYYSGVLEDAGTLELIKADAYVHKDSMEALLQYWMQRQDQISDTMMQRQLIQWYNIMIASQVNDASEISELQSELEKWLVTSDTVEGKPSGKDLEEMAKMLLVKRNDWAKALGFPGYIDMTLMVNSIQPEELQHWLHVMDTLTIQPYRAMVDELKEQNELDEVEIQDIFQLYFNYFRCGPPEPSKEERQAILSSTLNGLGMKYEELPILQREMQLPPPMGGQGISVRIPDNFKLVVNPNVGISTIFHEVGHGLACVYVRIPSPVLKGYEWIAGGTSPIMAEGLAEWAAGILQNPEWMKANTDLTEEEIAGKIKTCKKYAPVNIRFWLYNVWLELETFNNPELDVDSLRSTLLKRYLFVDTPSSRQHKIANSMYVSYPIYNHNYLFAEIIQWQIHNELESRLGSNYLFNPETASLMQEYFYKDGEYYHWQEKLSRFTKKGLDIEGYMDWITR
ncbi:MAG: hypothetical protein ISR57_07265 [Bacteroidales bacterium]|nr:hypothetical protein [Bacteroidota bacterium]MBL6950427.1 hypothetical protein [Bacteroidales bacterium]